jgi:ribosomal protein S18 acetylase RimI-like enzyme
VFVRRASTGEIEAAVAVWRSANATTALEHHPARLRRGSQGPGGKLFVAVEGDDLIGMILSLVARADDGAGPPIPGARHISGLAVLPDRQGGGIGGALLRAALDDARAEGCARVTLWTHAGNERALRLFEAYDFQPTGRTAYDDAGEPTVQLLATISRR